MKFEFYVLNWNRHVSKIESFNIFDNSYVQDSTEREIKKYLRSAKKYKYINFRKQQEYIGFEALCERFRMILTEEWSRVEYEISVGEPFCNDIGKLEKWDCYRQALPNIPTILRECIYQYKLQRKSNK